MNRLRFAWEKLRASFWFIPSWLVLGAILMALGFIELDYRLEWDVAEKFPRLFATGVEGAQGLLQAIATSVITVAGVTFSITILILNEASSQYSPRILRNFIRDRKNQVVLGAFLAVFVYCLVVLRSIHDIDDRKFVPPIAVTVGIVLAIVAIGVLIFFIHHIAYSIQASTIIQRAALETLEEIDELYPEVIGAGAERAKRETFPELGDDQGWSPVMADRSGYFEFTTPEDLLGFAEEHETIVRIEYCIGDFVIAGTPIVSLYDKGDLAEKETKELLSTLSISAHRTIEQDATFGIRQLVDIALKALSPSMNDTTTANMCVDHLTAIIARLIQRDMGSPYRLKDGRLRVIARRPAFDDLLNACLEQIRQNSRGNVCVLRQLIHTVGTVAPLTASPARLKALRGHLILIREVADTSVPSEADKTSLLRECDRTLVDLQLATAH